jgi:hypothetical protein
VSAHNREIAIPRHLHPTGAVFTPSHKTLIFFDPVSVSVILSVALMRDRRQIEATMTALGRLQTLLFAAAICLHLAGSASASAYRIEPDDYAEGANLNDILPVVDLRGYNGLAGYTFPDQFGAFPDPTVIPITANENEDIFGGYFTSTGSKSFGGGNVPFFNEGFQLAMKFSAPVSQVTIDFIGRSTLDTAIGKLEIFSPQGTLLDTFTSNALFAHEISTMTFARPQADIGYARAFSSSEANVFGALDNLRFTIGLANLPGDFNGNGTVDAADYVVWRNGLGTTHTVAQYQTWRETFGSHTGAGIAAPSTVPEPAAILTWLAPLLPGLLERSRSKKA